MLPNNLTTSKLKPQIRQPPALQFPSLLLPPFMTPSPLSPHPNPNSNSPLPINSDSIIVLSSDDDNDDQPQSTADAANLPLTEIAGVPHWVDPQQIGTAAADIDSVFAYFLDDTDAQFSGRSTSLDFNETSKGFLKRGIDFTNPATVDYLGLGTDLSIDDDNVTAKRSRKTEKQDNGNKDLGFEFQTHDLAHGSEFVGSISADEGDQRGKRKLVDIDSSSSGEEVDDDSVILLHRRFTREEKGKEQLIEIDFLSNALHEAGLALESDDGNLDIHDHLPDNVYQDRVFDSSRIYMERHRQIAKENAARFARFEPEPDDKDDGPSPEPPVEHEIDGCPTPFSLAMKIINERGKKSMQTPSWVPSRNQQNIVAGVSVPSLQELCLKILANNADAIVSLHGVPDDLRHKLSHLLCGSRKMNNHFFELLVSGSPTEIRLRDCSWLSEEQFTKSFQTCDAANLEVLQLDQCGRCISDYALVATLAQSSSWLPRLICLSLRGACRLTDKGLDTLVSSAPVLRSINLSECSLLTSASLNILADSLGSLLKELYLDDCQNIDAALIVPALKQFEHLEVLSLAGIQTVCDEFIKDYIIASGHNMKELVLKDCIKLTDASVKVIAEHCPGLCELDLMDLCKLTDLSIGYLTNSCRALRTLKLRRNPFSDEAIAAFMEITGESLKELSLNNIRKVGHHTALSLASHGKNLHTLDLSWCRNLTDNELGLIVDSCFSLRFLKLFGCSQVTDVFLNGHSNPEIQIIGLKLSPLLQYVKMPDPHQGALRYSPVS